MSDRSWIRRTGYHLLRVLSRFTAVSLFQFRCHGRDWYPNQGGALICANHQSTFDPVLVGLTCDRRMNYLARQSLFKIPLLRQLIQFLDAIPIERDGFGLAGIKETLRRLRRGELVLIFPEGTRTTDGLVGPFKPGVCALVRRGRAPVVPVGIDGAFEAMPRRAIVPRPAAIRVVIGEPITPPEAAELSDEELLAEIERRVRRCHSRAAASRAPVGRMVAGHAQTP